MATKHSFRLQLICIKLNLRLIYWAIKQILSISKYIIMLVILIVVFVYLSKRI